MVHAPGNETSVTGRNGIQGLVHGNKDGLENLVVIGLVVHEEGAQHGDQRKGRRGGHNHDDGHNVTQLTEHDTGHARHHGEGHEHAQHGERGGNNGDTHLGRAVDGGLLGFLSPLQV